MESRFHSKARTAAALQAEFVAWAAARAAAAQAHAEHSARTKQAQLVSFAEARVYREIGDFWAGVLLDDVDADSVVGTGDGVMPAARIP